MMMNIKISGMGSALPKESVTFSGNQRYRISGEETHLDLLVASARAALADAQMTIDDIDAIIAGVAVGLQPIPCTAVLIHEVISEGRQIPAFDVNSTCTSFLTALDLVATQIQVGRYQNVLIVSGDVGSISLNPKDKKSYELFGDGATSMVISKTENLSQGLLVAHQLTNSKGAHDTEIGGGGTLLPPYQYSEQIKDKYQFYMSGKKVLALALRLGTDLFYQTLELAGVSLDDIALVVPHQASPALTLMMKKLGLPKHQYVNILDDYGNMVSASVPFAFHWAVQQDKIKRGDLVLLIGTAAGLTGNSLLLRY